MNWRDSSSVSGIGTFGHMAFTNEDISKQSIKDFRLE
jgi:hypothetical protein